MKHYYLLILFTLLLATSNAQNPAWEPSVFIEVDNYGYVFCHDGLGHAEAFVTGGIPPFEYTWFDYLGNVVGHGLVLDSVPAADGGLYYFEVRKDTMVEGTGLWWEAGMYNPDSLVIDMDTHVLEGGFNISQPGLNDGQITTSVYGGIPGYSYEWSNGSHSANLSNLSAGTYTLTISDFTGCHLSKTVTLTQPILPFKIDTIVSQLHHGTNISCHGGTDGNINLTVSGGVPPYSYNWLGRADITEDLDSLPAGLYTVVVNDATEGGEDTISITLTQPPPLNLVLKVTTLLNGFNTSCHNCNDGKITAVVTGGVTTYSYLWNNGETTSIIDSLGKGRDTVVVTDFNGCIISGSAEITGDIEAWKIGGNLGIDTANQFIGTKDNKDVILKSNNTKRMTLSASGTVEMHSPLKLSQNISSNTDFKVVFAQTGGLINYIDAASGPPPCSNVPVNAWFTNSCGVNNIFLRDIWDKVGIGTLAPEEKLHVVGFERISPTSGSGYLNIGHDANAKINSYAGALLINDISQQNIKLCKNGGIVTIGTVTPNGNYRLFVRDGIRTEAVKVDLASANSWADHVFEQNYKLMKIDELEKYIIDNNHLPGIPSATEAYENGVELLEMNSKLLEKVEELTLYIIEQNKRIEKLEKK